MVCRISKVNFIFLTRVNHSHVVTSNLGPMVPNQTRIFSYTMLCSSFMMPGINVLGLSCSQAERQTGRHQYSLYRQLDRHEDSMVEKPKL